VVRDKGSLRVLIVDDHPVMRDGLVAAVEGDDRMIVAGQAGDAAESIRRYRELRPDVTLIDLEMRGTDGFKAIATIMDEDPSARILVIASSMSDPRIERALVMGAGAYLLKTATRVDIPAAIRSLANRSI